MCGISGIINSTGKIDLELLIRFNSIIKHRGPDDEGYVLINLQNDSFLPVGGNDTPLASYNAITGYEPKMNIDSVDSDFQVALGHRRLSILDLSPFGHLPMCDQTSNYWITYNGEVYNYIEIRNELISLGYTFKTETDTEVILISYIHWGADCLNKFMGMFSIAIYNRVGKKLFLARDRFGIKPLYYWFAPNGDFCFASEIKQFTTHIAWKPKLNKKQAFDYLYYGLTDHNLETLFEGVYHLPAASYFEMEVGGISPRKNGLLHSIKYYELSSTDEPKSFEGASDLFLERFKTSVQMHLRADVPIGSALSGGLDSSAIVCEINNLLKEEGKTELQKTFSAISSIEEFSERKWMDEVIKATKVEAHFVCPEVNQAFELTPKLLWHLDEPHQSQSALLGYCLFEKAKEQGVKVLLNGQGADEYISAYQGYRLLRWFHYFKSFKWTKLYKEVQHYGGGGIVGFIKQLLVNITYFFPDSMYDSLAKQSPNFKRLKSIIPPQNFADKFTHPYQGFNTKRRSLVLTASHQVYCNTLPRYLRWEDRNSMAHSVEARVPFLSHELISCVLAQPVEDLDGLDQPKKLMVHALRNLLPEAIKNRKDKKGFVTAEMAWMKKDKDNLYENALIKSAKILKDLIDEEKMIEYFKGIKSGSIPYDDVFWRVTLLGMWMDIFKVKIEK